MILNSFLIWVVHKLKLFTSDSTEKTNEVLITSEINHHLSEGQNRLPSEECVLISDQILYKETALSIKTIKHNGIYIFKIEISLLIYLNFIIY